METASLREVEWLPRYETGLHRLVDEFYVPALSRTVRYDRKAGFFSSSALVVAATGLARLVANQGRMRLLVGVRLSEEDIEAIAAGYARREQALQEALARAWEPPADFFARQRLAALAELVARGRLEIRVVVPTDESGRPLSAESAAGMFHEKSGIFTDAEGNRLVFIGSLNESATAWESNLESFHVYRSWGNDAAHADYEIQAFERLWDGAHPRALTLAFPQALRERLLEYRSDTPPVWDPAEREARREQDLREERERWLFQFVRDAPLLKNGEALVEEFAAVSPWPHQRRVYHRVCEDYSGRHHLLCDEVGLGKTIEAGFILRTLLLRRRVRRVLLLVPRNLVNQWREELREKFNLWAWWYDGRDYLDPLGQKHPAPRENPWDADYPLILASAQLARTRGRMERLLTAREWDLVLLDEAHHARRRWGPGGKQRPNRLMQLMDRLRERTRGLLLLTATPMQVDLRELWDLLRLAGMDGRWAQGWGEEFSRYFETLCRQDWSRSNLVLLTELVHDYFRNGGSEDPELKRRFLDFSGGFVLWRCLTSRQTPPDRAKVEEALRDPALAPLIQDFFREHTPVREYLFRYTRDLLRVYRNQGIFPANVPEREVQDVFLPLGPAQALYDQIQDYLAREYCQAFAENKQGRGYLMTVYCQRLTSSPWAISETLRRHRDRLQAILRGLASQRLYDELEDLELEDLLDASLEDEVDEALDDPQLVDLAALREEIDYLAGFLQALQALAVDPKLSQLMRDLQDLRTEHPRAVIFTQYTDTMDLLRERLREVYGEEVACFSGRGGQVWDSVRQAWQRTTKDDIKRGFFAGRYWILVCTDAASEGLNLQASDLLINYDMPWNPMRVEQRIGRIDRIGQNSPKVHIRNYYYQESVEAQIYQVLRDRLDLFATAVGPHQPVLGKTAKRIEKAAMAPAEERRQALQEQTELVKQDIEAAQAQGLDISDFARADAPLFEQKSPPCRADELRELFVHSEFLARSRTWRETQPGIFQLELRPVQAGEGVSKSVCFHQQILEAQPQAVEHCLSWGDPVFTCLLERIPAPRANQWGELARERTQDGLQYVWGTQGEREEIVSLSRLRTVVEQMFSLPPEA